MRAPSLPRKLLARIASRIPVGEVARCLRLNIWRSMTNAGIGARSRRVAQEKRLRGRKRAPLRSWWAVACEAGRGGGPSVPTEAAGAGEIAAAAAA